MIIELVGNFYNNHSLSIVNRNLALNLPENQVFITALDKPNPDFNLDKAVVKKLKNLEANKKLGIPDIQVRHTYPPIWRYPEHKKTKVVFIQPWEYRAPPLDWVFYFQTMADAVVSFSNFTSQIYANAGIDPAKIYTIPIGSDFSIFNTEKRDWSHRTKKRYIYVGAAGNSTQRKGADIMINGWASAFRSFNDVELIIKDNTNIYGKSNFLIDSLKAQYLHDSAEITYIEDQLSEHQMADLYRSCDYIVHPYRGEGYGLPVQEAVLCGCVPLITARGSTDDFIPDSYYLTKDWASKINTHVIPHRDLMLEPDLEDFVRKLQRTLEIEQPTKELFEKERLALKIYDNQAMSNNYLQVFEEVAELSETPFRSSKF